MQGLVVVSAAIIITINSPVSGAVLLCDDSTYSATGLDSLVLRPGDAILLGQRRVRIIHIPDGSTLANSCRLGKLRADLRRLTAICFSPLISLYHDTIDGVVMVRASVLPSLPERETDTIETGSARVSSHTPRSTPS